eukprot:2883551-Rhodomonas_salina.2
MTDTENTVPTNDAVDEVAPKASKSAKGKASKKPREPKEPKERKPKTKSLRGIQRGVQRPHRRLPEDLLRRRRVEYKRRIERHMASVNRTSGILAKYDEEFSHRGLAEAECDAAADSTCISRNE